MTNRIYFLAFALLSIFWLSSCLNENTGTGATQKLSAGDPFHNTITQSQQFSIDASTDNVVEGKKGTVAVFPKGCFKDKSGNIVADKVQVELTEALTLQDMILSNLTTTADGKPLITGGMLYFNATRNGEQLTVNKENPVYFEVPTQKRDPGMMVYKGIRDSNGTMNWTDPEPMAKFLTPVDINELEFLPEDFMRIIEYVVPFDGHETATMQLADSIYYALSYMRPEDLVKGFVATDYNEPYANGNGTMVHDGKYMPDAYARTGSANPSEMHDTTKTEVCGVDPASVKVIKTEKFQNTLIATREFEARFKYIVAGSDQEVLNLYVHNLDRNLYELDSMAAVILQKAPNYDKAHAAARFQEFAKQRLTNVKDGGKYAILLKEHYNKELRRVKQELKAKYADMMISLKQQNEQTTQLAHEYCEVLRKREAYRMQAYGFQWSETGWINIDNGTEPKNWEPAPLAALVTNGGSFDRVHSYIVYQSMKSIYRLNTEDNISFNGGSATSNEVLMPKSGPAVIISIGYKNDTPAVAVKSFYTGYTDTHRLTLQKVTMDALKDTLNYYERGYLTENSITADLNYMKDFFVEKQRQQKLTARSRLFQNLWNTSFPGCHTPPSKHPEREKQED